MCPGVHSLRVSCHILSGACICLNKMLYERSVSKMILIYMDLFLTAFPPSWNQGVQWLNPFSDCPSVQWLCGSHGGSAVSSTQWCEPLKRHKEPALQWLITDCWCTVYRFAHNHTTAHFTETPLFTSEPISMICTLVGSARIWPCHVWVQHTPQVRRGVWNLRKKV